MHTELNEACDHLAALRAVWPTPSRWAEVEEGLASKYEGVQVHAARVLGAWGGERATSLLHDWLLEQLERDSSWSAVGVAVEELRRCVGVEDTAWILDLYFGIEDLLRRHALLPLAVAMPQSLVEERISKERASDRSWRRKAANVLERRLRHDLTMQGEQRCFEVHYPRASRKCRRTPR